MGVRSAGAEIIATGVDGNPPYTVRWVEDDRESVVFPGPDAQVVSAVEQAEIHRLESAHIEKVQAELGTHPSGGRTAHRPARDPPSDESAAVRREP